MDYKDYNDTELDIQALLDKYLPEEEKAERIKKTATNLSGGKQAQDNNFYISEMPSGEGKAREDIAADFESAVEATDDFEVVIKDDEKVAPTDNEESVAADSETEAVAEDGIITDGAEGYESFPGLFDTTEIVFSDLFPEEAENDELKSDEVKNTESTATPTSESYDISDDSFVLDEESIAKILAEDTQFAGIEDFEDIEDLSGFSVDESEEMVDDAPTMEYGAAVEAAEEEYVDYGDYSEYMAEGAAVQNNNGDVLSEEDYAEFVNASLDSLDSDEASDTDINLIVAFGLEEQLKEKVGAKKASRMTKRFESELELQTERDKKTVHDEYKSTAQTKEISEKHKKRYTALKVKIAIATVFAALLMLFENIPLIGYQMAGAFDPAVYPVVYVMADLQLLLLCLAVAYEEVFRGFGAIFKGKLVPESILSISALFAIVVSSVTAYFAAPPVEPVVHNFPIAFCAVISLVMSFLTVKRDIFSFNVISSKKPKYALRHIDGKEAALEVAAFGGNSEEMGDVIKVEKVSFVDGYFYRTESRNSSNSTVILMSIILSLALSVLFGGYAGMMGQSFSHAVEMGYIAFIASIPMSVLLTYAYPFYKANADSYDNDATIIGENTLEGYSNASVVSFEDSLIFPSVGVKVQNIKIFNNYRFDRVLYYAASVFAKTGGPLGDVFAVATVESGYSEDVVLCGIGEGYINTEVNGKSIMFGKASALAEQGIEIPDEIKAEDDYESDTSVMYMIFKGKVVAKMNISYTVDDDFEYIVKQLAETGLSACIRTFDPNIDEDMVKRFVSIEKYPMRVIKCSSFEDVPEVIDNVDSGIAARGTAKALLKAITYCDKVLDVKRINSFISILATIVTIVILAIVFISGNMSSLRSLLIVLCQLFWMIPVLVSTNATVK